MKIFVKLLVVTLLASCYFGCTGEPQLPNTPEEVLRKYQEYVDNNQFDKASLLSTPDEGKRLNDMATMFLGELKDSTVFQTKFLEINCDLEGDTIQCGCIMQDDYEQYEAVYQLVRLNGQWLVDAPQETEVDEIDILEELVPSQDTLN